MTKVAAKFEYCDLLNVAEYELEMLRFKREKFTSLSVADYAWTILLETYVADSKSLKSQCIFLVEQSGAPYATGLRYLNYLEEAGLLQRYQMPGDPRSNLVELTALGRKQMDEYFFTACNAGRERRKY